MKEKIAGVVIALISVACSSTIKADESYNWQKIPPTEFTPVTIEAKSTEEPETIIETIPALPTPSQKSRTQPHNAPRSQAIVPKVSAPSGAKKYALGRVGAYQYSCLLPLWDHESHWNYRSYNHSSGAYGIPQALPGSKMASAGTDWRTNPITQVKWGIHYVNVRYGSACGAWRFWQGHGWY